MPTNRDGTFTGDGGFGGGGYSGGETPLGSGVTGSAGYSDDGTKVWNPTGGPDGKGAYETPNGTNTATSVAGDGRNPDRTGAGGWSNGTGGTNGLGNGDATTTGKAGTFGNGVTVQGAGDWGGYGGTYVQGPNGEIVYDAGQSGRAEAVNRARNLGELAANRAAPQIDYTAANGFAGMGQQDRGTQVDAMGLAQQTANGTNLQSMQLGQQMLDQGVQAQQAAAASSRGGALAQAAARSQQVNGQGSFVAQGNTQLQAQRANEMAAGRDAYMGQASALRASDAQGQNLQQQQALAQQQQELQQRQQNQQTQMAYETQGQNVNNAAADAALSRDEIAHGYDATQTARQTQMANRQAQTVAAGVNCGRRARGEGEATLSSAEARRRSRSRHTATTRTRTATQVSLKATNA
jgi:hypothetical protein